MKFNFGATLHRVVSLDIADAAFTPDTSELRSQWQGKFEQLLTVLEEGPAVLRLTYLGDVESRSLAKTRLKKIEQEITRRWDSAQRTYRLTLESKIFWRHGAPLK